MAVVVIFSVDVRAFLQQAIHLAQITDTCSIAQLCHVRVHRHEHRERLADATGTTAHAHLEVALRLRSTKERSKALHHGEGISDGGSATNAS